MVNTCEGGCGLRVSYKGMYRKGHEENPDRCGPDSHKAEAAEAKARNRVHQKKY